MTSLDSPRRRDSELDLTDSVRLGTSVDRKSKGQTEYMRQLQ